MTADASTLMTRRVWCIHASDAPIVAVVMRCYAAQQWTCILRWNWKKGTIDEGAWTTMSISAPRCCVSPDGEFLLYHASGPTDGPFNAQYGGAFAISRLPWLSALTDPQTFGPGGGSQSRDALRGDEQEQLWAKFMGWPMHVRDEHWPCQLGWGWSKGASNMSSSRHLVASHAVPNSDLHLVANVVARTTGDGAAIWSVWDRDLRISITRANEPHRQLIELPDVVWAGPADHGRVIVATADAKLRVLRFDSDDAALAPVVAMEHDLGSLVPNPRSAPSWAKATLY